ncbi:MAG: serine/threonine protein kinase [Verrucomicrobiales bacterium]|nr:serine/threonine protein kinase [Verrucomicrobiales bacterium]
MGIVYEAAQLGVQDFRKRVALKIIRDQLARQKMFIENFIGEAKLVADLIHTNIVQTYHLGAAQHEAYYITMEFINGVNLEQFTTQLKARKARLPTDLAVFIASRVARALSYAHAKTGADGRELGIVHRDVNPKNIMIAFEGDVKLMDFGVAKARGFLTDQEGEVAVGKPEYMSPEQADFQVTDRRSDIFSTGVVLLELLLQRNPFKGATSEESRRNVVGMRLPPFEQMIPGLDDALGGILQRCLHREPSARYAFCGALRDDLERRIYSQGYGPTNEKLGEYVRGLFGQVDPAALVASRGGTQVIEHTARLRQRRERN